MSGWTLEGRERPLCPHVGRPAENRYRRPPRRARSRIGCGSWTSQVRLSKRRDIGLDLRTVNGTSNRTSTSQPQNAYRALLPAVENWSLLTGTQAKP